MADLVTQVEDGVSQPARIGVLDAQQMERDALCALAPDAGEAREFVDEPLRDDAGKVRRSALREARISRAASS